MLSGRRLALLPRGNVGVISVRNFLTGMYETMVGFVLQPFVLGFGGGVTLVGVMQALAGRVSGLVSALVQPFGGYLADVRGRRAVALLGSGFAIVAMALFVLAAIFQREPWALALVVPAFVSMALSLVASPALQSVIAESAEPARRASAYATAIFFWVLPGAVLAIPGGVIADRLGYGAVFGIAFGFEAANLVLFWHFLRETATPGHIHPWRERLARSLRPPQEVRGLFVIVALDAFAWGLAAGIIYGLTASEFGFSNAQLGAIAASWSLFFAIFLPPTALFVNRFGLKRSILFSEFLGVPIMIGWLFSSRIEHFVLMGALNGLTAATWVPAVQTYVANWTTKERRAEVLGSLAAFRGLVAFPAPFLGGLLYDSLGYPAPLLANLVGAIATTAAIALLLRDPPQAGIETSSPRTRPP